MRSVRITGSLAAAGNGMDKAPAANSRFLMVRASPSAWPSRQVKTSEVSPPQSEWVFSWAVEISAFSGLRCGVDSCHRVCQLRQHGALLWEPRAAPLLAVLLFQQPKADLWQESTTWEMHAWKNGAGAAEPCYPSLISRHIPFWHNHTARFLSSYCCSLTLCSS